MFQSLSKKSIHTGFRLFILFTVCGFFVIFFFKDTEETVTALRYFRFEYFLLAAVLVGLDFTTGAARIFIFIRKISPLSDMQAFWAAFKANLGNIFMAAATPFQTGGGVAQLYLLHRAGIPVSVGISVGVINFIATLIFLMIGGLVVLGWIRRTFPAFQLQLILTISSAFFYGFTVLFIIFLFRPMLISRFIQWILYRFGKIWRGRSGLFQNWAQRAHDFIEQYQTYLQYFWRHERALVFYNVWITFGLFFNKCFIAYIVLKGMGLNPDFTRVIGIQICMIFLIYFCPTPGASFLAETSAAALMSLLIPAHLTPVYSVLWRFFTTYFGVILGGLILMRILSRAPVIHPDMVHAPSNG
jgi:uncharacterized protein (TIRG00374 family)